jgi:hypothetical protein
MKMTNFTKTLIKKLDDPKTAKKVHGRAGLAWLAASIPICIFLSSSIPFIVFVSVYAIVVGHWSGWDAAGGEVEIEKLHERIDKLEKK